MTPLEYLQTVGEDMNKPKRYMVIFELEDGMQLPLTMEGTSVDDALWAIIKSRPYLDLRDCVRYTWTELPDYERED